MALFHLQSQKYLEIFVYELQQIRPQLEEGQQYEPKIGLHMSICCEKNLHTLPPTELWFEHPATVRERTGSGSAKGMAAGMHTQTVLLAPPSTPRMTLPMRGLWHSSMFHISLPEYLCILLAYPSWRAEDTTKRST